LSSPNEQSFSGTPIMLPLSPLSSELSFSSLPSTPSILEHGSSIFAESRCIPQLIDVSVNLFDLDEIKAKRGPSRREKITSVLSYLSSVDISPIELLLFVFDADNESDVVHSYKSGLLRDTNNKLETFLDLVMLQKKGTLKLRQWMEPYLRETMHALVLAEMKLLDRKHKLSGTISFTPQFITDFQVPNHAQDAPELFALLSLVAQGNYKKDSTHVSSFHLVYDN
jgi:hypothetical protein